MTEDGVLIGTTGMDGVLADVKGAAKVAVTHVAYKPQLVIVASLLPRLQLYRRLVARLYRWHPARVV